VPLRLNGPNYFATEVEVLLPDEASDFTVKGRLDVDEMIGGVEIKSSAAIKDNRFTLKQSTRSVAYDKLLADAETDDERVLALSNRSYIREQFYDFAGALEDVNVAIDLERTTKLLWTRASMLRKTGDLEGALADYEAIEALEPNGRTYYDQIEILALLGRADDALLLAEDYRGLGSNEMVEDMVAATAMGWAGDAQEGLQMLDDRRVMRPGDGTLLLDSRALAYYRMGDLEKAKADLDAALLLEPGLSESRLLRGVVRVAQGDKKGSEDIDLALRMNPSLRATYTAWGLKLPRQCAW